MSGYDEPGRWREVATGLRGLRPEPPPTLRPAVLERVGLADAWFTVAGPAGPLLVAYNGRGISATAPAGDEARFEARFLARHRRPLRRAGEPPARLLAQLQRYMDPGARGAPPQWSRVPRPVGATARPWADASARHRLTSSTLPGSPTQRGVRPSTA